jgi:hypothetical protein
MGDGGGFSSSPGEVASSPSSCDGEVGPGNGESGASVRLALEIAGREIFPDLRDAESDLSTRVSPLLNPDVELRGLSVLLPGILDLSPRKDLIDSLVSALLNDGYDWRLSTPLSNEVCDTLPLGVDSPEPLEV